jgi:hypothetical protein
VTSSEIDALRERAQQWIEDFEGAAVRPGETFLIIRDLLAALEAQQGGWQPMATAPKDGTRVLLWPCRWTAEGMATAFYNCGMWWIESPNVRGEIRAFTDPVEDATHWPFTHWRKLPEPPR